MRFDAFVAVAPEPAGDERDATIAALTARVGVLEAALEEANDVIRQLRTALSAGASGGMGSPKAAFQQARGEEGM